MKLRSVKPAWIKVPDIRVTSNFDSEALAMFKQSIKALGIVEPPICIEVDSEIVLVDGLHRVVEAIQNKIGRIQVALMDGTMRDVLLQNVALNNLRGSTSPTQMSAVFKELMEEHGMGTDDIAKETGFSRDYVEKLVWISRAQTEVLDALDGGLIKVGHAFALSRIPDPDIQKNVLAQQLMYRWPVKDLEEHIRDVKAEAHKRVEQPAPPAPKEAPKFPCHYCGGLFEATMVANPNTCASCAGILLGAIQVARAEAEQAAAAAEGSLTGAEGESKPPSTEAVAEKDE